MAKIQSDLLAYTICKQLNSGNNSSVFIVSKDGKEYVAKAINKLQLKKKNRYFFCFVISDIIM